MFVRQKIIGQILKNKKTSDKNHYITNGYKIKGKSVKKIF